MKSIKIDDEITKKIKKKIPETLIQQRDGGKGTKLSYISGSTVIDMLNDAFGYAWSWELKRTWIEESAPFFNIYSKSSNLEDYNGKKGAWEPQPPVAHAQGTLTVYLETEKGLVEVKKDGTGSKAIIGKQSEQDSIFKAAGTDALKKAASLFGIGLELYRNEAEESYFNEINYEDPWTDELKEEYADCFTYLNEYKSTYGVSDDAFATFLHQVTGDHMLTPSNIGTIIDYIQLALAQ